jgi:hypothetical protein
MRRAKHFLTCRGSAPARLATEQTDVAA